MVDQFAVSLKLEWLANVIHLAHEGIINDINHYIRCYNETSAQATLDNQTPNQYENPQINMYD